MPMRRVQFLIGEYYHLFNRGAGRSSIFRTDEDYRQFLSRLRRKAKLHSVTVIAYCLLPNHFHLLVRQNEDASAGTMVQHLCNGYAQWFNHRHERTGTLFQGRFSAVHVRNDPYLRHLCRYIHGNPVRHGIALQPALWTYSNYLDWLEVRPGNHIDREFISAHFGGVERYVAYVMSYLTSSRDVPEKLQTYLQGLEE